MTQHELIVVGAGPAGSTCAERLASAGMDVLLLDRAEFPRNKLCAGWVTPRVLEGRGLCRERPDVPPDGAGGLDVAMTLEPITAFRIGQIGSSTERDVIIDYGKTISYGVLRHEFDHWLLGRAQAAGAHVRLGTAVKSLEHDRAGWTVNGEHRARMLVGAGGHFCPVARHLSPRSTATPFVCQEVELRLVAQQAAACPVAPHRPELFFSADLRGYGWCFRKGDWLNIGLGREDRADLPGRVRAFADWLHRENRLPPTLDLPERWGGHAYFAYDTSPRPLAADDALLIGDAAGLADPKSGEGIGPAIESAHHAADAIIAGRPSDYAPSITARYGPRQTRDGSIGPSPWRIALGRWLLRRRWFARRVILDRWFLGRG